MDKKDIKTTETAPTITVGQLRKLLNKLETFEDNAELTFEFMMTALYPDVYKRIQKYSNDCYASGYLAGLKEGKNEN
jgi:uncharacterized protein (UPF0335 family)